MCMLLALAGCGSNKREETGGCKIWYMNQAETKLEAESKELQAAVELHGIADVSIQKKELEHAQATINRIYREGL